MKETIEQKLIAAFQPTHLEVENESHMHNVPQGSETHFRVLVVSGQFTGLSRVARQRLVNEVLVLELRSGVHALAQRCLTPDEFGKTTSTFQSPECHGGSKH